MTDADSKDLAAARLGARVIARAHANPVAAAIVGAAATISRPPSRQMVSAIQHLPAGVVSAAAAGEVLPDLKPPGAATPLLIGGTAGMSAMMAIMQMEAKAKTSVRLLATVAVDLFIDGLVLGLGCAAGATQGWLPTVALTIEILFFGLPSP